MWPGILICNFHVINIHVGWTYYGPNGTLYSRRKFSWNALLKRQHLWVLDCRPCRKNPQSASQRSSTPKICSSCCTPPAPRGHPRACHTPRPAICSTHLSRIRYLCTQSVNMCSMWETFSEKRGGRNVQSVWSNCSHQNRSRIHQKAWSTVKPCY